MPGRPPRIVVEPILADPRRGLFPRSTRGRRRRLARRPGPVTYDLLEDRTLLDGTPISSAQVQSILTGLQALQGAGVRAEMQANVLNQPLHFLARPGQTVTPATLAPLVPLGDFLTNTLFGTAETALSAPGPTIDGLVNALSAATNADVTGGESNGVLTFTLSNIVFSGSQDLGIDLSGVNRFYNLGTVAPVTSSLQVSSIVTIPDLLLNVNLSDNEFYINTPKVVVTQLNGTLETPFGVPVGFLSASVVDGTVDLASTPGNPAEVSFFDPFGQGRLTTAELEDSTLTISRSSGSMSLNARLTIQASLGTFHTDASQPPILSISDPDVFSAGREWALVGHEPDHQFRSVDAVQHRPGWADHDADQSDCCGPRSPRPIPALEIALPFVNNLTVGGALDRPGTVIRTILFNNLTKTVTDPTTGTTTLVPTFQTAQDLAAQLAMLLGVPVSSINPEFDPATDDLTFTVSLDTVNAPQDLPFSLSRPVLGVTFQTAQNAVAANAGSTISFTFGSTLVPTVGAAPVQSALPANGQLQGDAHFDLVTNTDAPVAVTVARSATLDNHSPLDLVADINSALSSTGITGVVANLTTPNPVLSGSLPVPANGQLDGDAKFQLTIDGRRPISVTVPRSATQDNTSYQDLVNDFNAAIQSALQAAGLATNLVALHAGDTSQVLSGGLPIPANGQLNGDAHFSLTLPSSATSAAITIPVTVPQSATLGNTVPQELVGDFNTAIQAALRAAQIDSTTVGSTLITLGPEIIGTLPIPANGRLSNDSYFSLSINNGTPVDVTVPQSATASNQSAQDLVGDFNAALDAKGLGTIIARFEGADMKFAAVLGAGINTMTLRTTVLDPLSAQFWVLQQPGERDPLATPDRILADERPPIADPGHNGRRPDGDPARIPGESARGRAAHPGIRLARPPGLPGADADDLGRRPHGPPTRVRRQPDGGLG